MSSQPRLFSGSACVPGAAWRAVICALLVPCLLVLTGCEKAADDSGGGMGLMGGRGAVQVVVAEARAQSYVDSVTALGNLRANEAVDISSRISSVVKSVHFQDGQLVQTGALLVALDAREIAAELGVAQAELEKVRSQYERSRSLSATQVVSEAELDQLAADMRGAEADVRAAQARLDDTRILAPITGFVGLRQVSPGDLVGPDQLITTLDDTRVMKLDFSVPSTYLSTVELGMTVAATTSAFPDERFVGQVTSIDTRIDPLTRSITVVAEIPNPDNRLKPGLFMTVVLQREREQVLFIPEQALAPRAGRQYVFVVNDGSVTEREVRLGARSPGRAEVVDGLAPGDIVVAEGVQKVRNGSPVEIIRSLAE